MRIALFKNATFEWAEPHPWKEGSSLEGYVQISEVVDIDFPPLSAETIVRGQLDALDVKEQELRNAFQKTLDAITNRRAELQSLTYVPA